MDSIYNFSLCDAFASADDVTVAAVTVDDKGVIQSCTIDSIPATIEFDATGSIVTDLATVIDTKNEKGENYGMVAWGGAIAEWDAQVKAVADYAVGKTVEELKNGDIDMTTGKAKDGTDLQSSATIYLAGYVYAIEAAVNNAQHLGAQAGDELVLTTMNEIKSSTPADAENAGNAQLDSTIAVLTRKDGVITSCYIDSLQAALNVAEDGTVAAGNTLSGFRDVYLAYDFSGGTISIGQFKPYRSMEELTSSKYVIYGDGQVR